MKKLLLMFGALALVTTAFTGCNDDDDDKNYAKAVAGAYSGDLTVSLLGEDAISDVPMTVTRTSDKKVNITATVSIPGETPVNLPVTLTGVTLAGTLDNMTLTFDDKIDLSSVFGEKNKDLKAELSKATIKGENTMSFTLTVSGFTKPEAETEDTIDIVISTADAKKKEAK